MGQHQEVNPLAPDLTVAGGIRRRSVPRLKDGALSVIRQCEKYAKEARDALEGATTAAMDAAGGGG
jgi:hypothetical protein